MQELPQIHGTKSHTSFLEIPPPHTHTLSISLHQIRAFQVWVHIMGRERDVKNLQSQE